MGAFRLPIQAVPLGIRVVEGSSECRPAFPLRLPFRVPVPRLGIAQSFILT